MGLQTAARFTITTIQRIVDEDSGLTANYNSLLLTTGQGMIPSSKFHQVLPLDGDKLVV